MKINPRFVDKLKLSMNIVGVIPPPIPQIFNNFPLKKRGSAEHESEPMTCQPLPNIPSSFMTFTNSSNIPRFGRRFKSWLLRMGVKRYRAGKYEVIDSQQKPPF